MPMLEVNRLSVAYGERKVLRDISLKLRPGSVLGVIGPNGAGKSTLVRTLSGVIAPKSGSICLDGRDLTRLSAQERARSIAVVPQARNLPAGFTAWQLVLLGRTPYLNWFGQVSAQDEAIVYQVMERTRTLELADRPVGELSGGEHQRLLLARALVQSTPVLLLDEPTTHLDLRYQVNLLDEVRELVRHPAPWMGENGSQPISVLVVLHDLNLVARYTDEVALLVDGQIQAMGSPDEVLSESVLSPAYKIPLEVWRDTPTGKPVILPAVS